MKKPYNSIKALLLLMGLSSSSLQAQYCNSQATSTADEEIFNVTIGTLNNTSSCATTGGAGSIINMYSNYTATVPAPVLVLGNNYPASMTVGQCGGTAWSGQAYIWIDYNGNFSFTDPGEQVYISPANTTFNVAGTLLNVPGGVTIPLTAIPGTTRMRVTAVEGGFNQTPCGNFTWGETEDYNVVIGGGTPCAGTPSANAVVSPTAPICPNTSAQLGLALSYTVGGMTYQWQSSTVSPVGPFVSIPGATAPILSSPNLTTTTYFTAIITCTNGNGSVTATSSSVGVQGITINNVPYFEGFEGITANDQLPNCSWAASNLPASCQTYTSSQSDNRMPYEGNNFASFYYSPGGSDNFYSNGIQLYTGITYSASLWYTTEIFGNNNFSVSLSVGPNQSNVGSVMLDFDNPAISPFFKSLSSTFTVATSGIYYMGIEANSSGCCAQWLSWDALSVIAPCSLNPFGMGLTANTTTICQGQTANLTATGANTYTWNTGSNNAALLVSPQFNTMYTVVGTNTLSGCSSTLSQLINVNTSPAVVAIAAQGTVCSGKPANLIAFASGAATYTWNNGLNGANIVVTPTANTLYTVIASNTLGCSSTATVGVSVYAIPNVLLSSSATNSLVCEDDETTLTGSGAVSYQWASNSSILLGAVVLVSPNTTTTYTLMGTDANGCSKSVAYELTVTNCTGIKNVTTTQGGISLYPNPTSGLFTVELNSGSVKSIELTDVTGRVILNKSYTEGKVSFDLSSYSNGIYYVKVLSQNASEVIKVVKQ